MIIFLFIRIGLLNLGKDSKHRNWKINASTGNYAMQLLMILKIPYICSGLINLINKFLSIHSFSRYKIFVEGKAWSVSDKYILACDSMTLMMEPVYHDFFLRGMIPMEHYWPIRLNNKCRDIKFAVEWGNKHIKEVLIYFQSNVEIPDRYLNGSANSSNDLQYHDSNITVTPILFPFTFLGCY